MQDRIISSNDDAPAGPDMYPLHADAPPAGLAGGMQDTPCLQCGYDLRGLPTEGNCPECGTVIARSLQGNFLRYSALDYLRSLQFGLLLSIIAYVVSVLSTILGIFVMFTMMAGPAPAQWTTLEILNYLAMFGYASLAVIGWWKFSVPDPAFIGRDAADVSRRVVRVAIVMYAIMTLLHLVLFTTVQGAMNVPNAGDIVVWFGLLLATAVHFFASLIYIRLVARRIPDQSIVTRSTQYLWLLPLIYIVGSCILIGPLIATIMYVLLLEKLRLQINAILNTRDDNEPTFSTVPMT